MGHRLRLLADEASQHRPCLDDSPGLGRFVAPYGVPIRGRESEAFGDIPLGVDARAQFAQNNIALSAGDRLLLYADGITEVPNANGEPFGLERLAETLKRTSGDELEHIRTGVLDALLVHTANSLAHDDVTLMVLEVAGETELGPAS